MKQYTLIGTAFHQAQDVSALELLFALNPFLPERYRIDTLYIDCRGNVKSKFGSLEECVATLRGQRLVANISGETKLKGGQTMTGELRYVVPRINFDVTLSPTNEIWHKSEDWPADVVEAEWQWHDDVASLECRTRLQEIDAAPLRLNFVTAVDAPDILNADGAAHQLFDEMVRRFPALLNRRGVYLSLDVVDDLESWDWRDGADEAVKQWPGIAPMLGRRVDKLHEIMIAGRDTCHALHTRLSQTIPLKPLYSDLPTESGQDDVGELTMLLVPKDVIRDPACLEAVRDFFAPRNHATIIREVGWGPGEYRLDSRYYAQWHYNELIAARKIAPSPPILRRFATPLIAPRYMELLGIDPQAMLVTMMQPPNLARDNDAVDAVYAAQPENTPLGQRVWNAYRAMWRQYWPHHSPEFTAFMRDNYFPGID